MHFSERMKNTDEIHPEAFPGVLHEKMEALEIKQGEKVIPFLAKADGNDIIIILEEIINGKVSVEFAQGKWYRVNLCNSADIPAVPFKSEVTI